MQWYKNWSNVSALSSLFACGRWDLRKSYSPISAPSSFVTCIRLSGDRYLQTISCMGRNMNASGWQISIVKWVLFQLYGYCLYSFEAFVWSFIFIFFLLYHSSAWKTPARNFDDVLKTESEWILYNWTESIK